MEPDLAPRLPLRISLAVGPSVRRTSFGIFGWADIFVAMTAMTAMTAMSITGSETDAQKIANACRIAMFRIDSPSDTNR